jgi:hypothetical protein
MEELVRIFTQLGVTGAVVVVLIYDVFFLQRKLISIIEQNTAAITKLQGIVETLVESVDRHRDYDK